MPGRQDAESTLDRLRLGRRPTRPILNAIPQISLNKKIIALLSIGVAAWAGSAQELTVTPTANNTNAPITVRTASGALGSIKRLDPALDALLAKDAVIEKLAKGFDWSEGPVWMPGGYLLFSDVPQNTIFKWNARSGVAIFLQPSGYTGTEPRGGERTHPRQARPAYRLPAGRPARGALGEWQICRRSGSLRGQAIQQSERCRGEIERRHLFHRPSVRSAEELDDPSKEIPFQGVYRVSAKDGSVTLLTSEIAFPNGLAVSLDEKILYVASSDPSKAIWMAYPVNADGTLGAGRVFLDVTDSPEGGLPDGLKVESAATFGRQAPAAC